MRQLLCSSTPACHQPLQAGADNCGDNFQLRGTVTTQLAAGAVWTTGQLLTWPRVCSRVDMLSPPHHILTWPPDSCCSDNTDTTTCSSPHCLVTLYTTLGRHHSGEQRWPPTSLLSAMVPCSCRVHCYVMVSRGHDVTRHVCSPRQPAHNCPLLLVAFLTGAGLGRPLVAVAGGAEWAGTAGHLHHLPAHCGPLCTAQHPALIL